MPSGRCGSFVQNGFVADECESVGGCSRIYKYSTNVTCLRTESGYSENP